MPSKSRIVPLGSVLVTLLAVWAALAKIAPKLFQISWEPPQGFFGHTLDYLWNPALVWLALAVAAAWFGWIAVVVFRRLEIIDGREQAREERFMAWLAHSEKKITASLDFHGQELT